VCPDGQAQEFTPVAFRVFDKIQTVTPAAIVENTRLGAALTPVRQHQATYAPHKRRYDQTRQWPLNNLEAPPSKSRPRRERLRLTGARLSHDAWMSAFG
jgi:hypothetical protein